MKSNNNSSFQGIKGVFTRLYLRYYLNRPFKKYSIEVVNDPDTLHKIFNLRYEIYCLRDKLLKPDNYPDGIEKDEYDDSSVHFAIFDHKRNVVGTVRLIKYTSKLFPTESEFELQSKLSKIPHEKMVEISRFLLIPEFRKTMLMIDLCKSIYLYSKKNEIDYWLGCAENWFIDALNKLFGPLDIIGDPHVCFNAMNYPFTLLVAVAEKNVKMRNKVLFWYFTHQTSNLIL